MSSQSKITLTPAETSPLVGLSTTSSSSSPGDHHDENCMLNSPRGPLTTISEEEGKETEATPSLTDDAKLLKPLITDALENPTSDAPEHLPTTTPAVEPATPTPSKPQLYWRPELAEATHGLHPVLEPAPYVPHIVWTDRTSRLDYCCEKCRHIVHHAGIHKVWSVPPEVRGIENGTVCAHMKWHSGECEVEWVARQFDCGGCGKFRRELREEECVFDGGVVCELCGWRVKGYGGTLAVVYYEEEKAKTVANKGEVEGTGNKD